MLSDQTPRADPQHPGSGSATWPLSHRQRCDFELLASGAFAPLRSYLSRADYEAVCDRMRLQDDSLWPMPITLDVPETTLREIGPSGRLTLQDLDGTPLGVLTVADAWRPDVAAEADAVFGSTDHMHPGAQWLMTATHPWYLSGTLEILGLPAHADFTDLRHTPDQLAAVFAGCGWTGIVAFNTRNPMHRAHEELTSRSAKEVGAKLLLHPIVGVTRPGDVPYPVRVRCYQATLRRYPPGEAMLSLLPLAMRMGGPREALWHAIIRHNYGASAFIVGRDHAGPGNDSTGRPFYGPYDAQALVNRHQSEIGITMVPSHQLVYLPRSDSYVAQEEVPPGTEVWEVSGTLVRHMLATNQPIPSWLMSPAVSEVLQQSRQELNL